MESPISYVNWEFTLPCTTKYCAIYRSSLADKELWKRFSDERKHYFEITRSGSQWNIALYEPLWGSLGIRCQLNMWVLLLLAGCKECPDQREFVRESCKGCISLKTAVLLPFPVYVIWCTGTSPACNHKVNMLVQILTQFTNSCLIYLRASHILFPNHFPLCSRNILLLRGLKA